MFTASISQSAQGDLSIAVVRGIYTSTAQAHIQEYGDWYGAYLCPCLKAEGGQHVLFVKNGTVCYTAGIYTDRVEPFAGAAAPLGIPEMALVMWDFGEPTSENELRHYMTTALLPALSIKLATLQDKEHGSNE